MSGRGGRGRHNNNNGGGRGRDSGRGRSEGRGGRGGRGGPPGGRGGGRGSGREPQGRGRGGREQHRGGRGGRDAGRGGGRDAGRGAGRGSEPPCPPQATTNLIPCTISSLQTFYVYGIDCRHPNNKPIDSRSRRSSLFYLGVFGPNGLLERHYSNQSNSAKEVREQVDEWKRLVYFQNSVLFTPRPLPLDVSQGPILLVGDTVKSDNGDVLSVTDCTVYSPPVELVGPSSGSTASSHRAAPQATEVTIDLRCKDCIKSFKDEKAMMLHCRTLGHSPVTVDVGGKEETMTKKKAANREVFLQYANVVLKRALGERLKPW